MRDFKCYRKSCGKRRGEDSPFKTRPLIRFHAPRSSGLALSSELQGGDFLSGFASAGFAKAFTPVTVKIAQGNKFAGAAISALAGGAAAELGGGKFANGALTGAMGYLFNQARSMERKWKKMMAEFKKSVKEAYDLGTEFDATTYIDKVREQGDWDFKNRQEYHDLKGVEQFGNFAFGATSQAWADGATGGLSVLRPDITTDLVMRGAGLYQQHFQSSLYDPDDGKFYDKSSFGSGQTNYGDNSRDAINIYGGAQYYYRNREALLGTK